MTEPLNSVSLNLIASTFEDLDLLIAGNLNELIEQRQKELNHLTFLSKVKVSDGCWNWTGMYQGYGYGQTSKIVDGKKKWIYAHRYAYEYYHGQIPQGTVVMHSCDNRRCVDPMHLYVGSQKENIADKVKKGRANYRAVTQEIANEIRERNVSAMQDITLLASEYGLSPQTVYSIIKGKSHNNEKSPKTEPNE